MIFHIGVTGDLKCLSMRFCLTEAEEKRLNHTVKNIKIRMKNIRVQIKNIGLKKRTRRDHRNLGEYKIAHFNELRRQL